MKQESNSVFPTLYIHKLLPTKQLYTDYSQLVNIINSWKHTETMNHKKNFIT